MEQTTEHPLKRYYCIQLGASQSVWPPVIRVRADLLCESDAGRKIELKRSGQLVARITGNINAWWIEEE